MMIDLDFVLDHPIQVSVGLLISILLGFVLEFILGSINAAIKNKPPRDFQPHKEVPDDDTEHEFQLREWREAVSSPETISGRWLGIFERAVFFLAVGLQVPTIIFAWLTFKVASKWSVWQNIVKLPDKEIEKIEMGPRARRALGSIVMQRFLVGTIFNIFAALISWGIVLLMIHSW